MTTAVLAHCSFCARPNTEVKTLVSGPGVFICDGCVSLCAAVIEGKPASIPRVAPWDQELTLDDVLSRLAPVASAGAQVQQNLTAWVRKARTLGGTWTRIGAALGMTRQSAWERFSGEE
ncbi:ClpX C4-type zinc finger protein [Amycolatopsis sp., V23-08]|uniref:ClpX C4-type zinc finger protein n=1 Tax=Amycolatopsis heterodermiae TaxID=3110235 RepID=A0ABU5R5R6_9PSEU|nr:ClpX C4-type zinc finger protein [Amycolatopsis sp., V23-08]MEA5361503.1 ClpX C4-type zinc finger protein [Amycolatopsis sp., V23-08]